MKLFSLIRRHITPLVVLCCLIGAGSQVAQAQNFIYTNDDINGPNTVSAFSVSSTGVLTAVPGSPFMTGGTGSGGGFFAANRATIRAVGNFLYISNSQSLNISGFSIDPTTGILTSLGSPTPSGAAGGNGPGISIAVTPDNKWLIAGNSLSQTLTVFSIGSNGSLTLASGPTAVGGNVDGIKVSPDGKFLAVALPNNTTPAVAMFSINDSAGVLTPVTGSPFAGSGIAGAGTAGVDINSSSTLLFAGEGNGSETIVDVYSIAATGVLSAISGSPFVFTTTQGAGQNSNEVLLSNDGRFLFVSNQFSAAVTVLSVASNGSLSSLAGSPFSVGTGGLEPAGMAENQAGTFLYTADFTNSVSVLSIASNGALTLATGSPFNTGRGTGLLSLTAFPTAAATTFTTPQQPVSPGTSPTFTNATVAHSDQTWMFPANATFGSTASMSVSFIKVDPSVFNSTRLPGIAQNPNWSGGITPIPPGTACTVYDNTGGKCMVMRGHCFDANGNPITCTITAASSQLSDLITISSKYELPALQPNPGMIIGDDQGTPNQNDWAILQNLSFNSDCCSGSGGTRGTTVEVVIVDLPPVITITTPPNNAAYALNQAVLASYTCSDPQPQATGFPTCLGTVAQNSNIDTASGGVKTFTVNSTDAVGTMGRQSTTYSVVPYNASVQPPINADGSSIFNAKRGVIPIKFTLTQNNVATCALPAATIALTRTAGGTLGTIDESVYLMAADTGSNFRIDSCQYIYNLASSSLGPGTYEVDIIISGAVVGSGVFALK